MARTRSENYGDIQKSILTKAAALYSADGYMRSSIADLAEASGLSRGALYHYFDSKETILFAILDAHLRHMIASIEAAIAAAPPDPSEQFRSVVTAIVEVNAASPNEQRVLLNDLSFLGTNEQHNLNALGRRIVEIMADLLDRLDANKRINARTKKVYTMMLFGMINYTYTWYDPSGPVDPAEFADLTIELFLDGFTAPRRRLFAAPRRKRARA